MLQLPAGLQLLASLPLTAAGLTRRQRRRASCVAEVANILMGLLDLTSWRSSAGMPCVRNGPIQIMVEERAINERNLL
jgi:hypothetical protein